MHPALLLAFAAAVALATGGSLLQWRQTNTRETGSLFALLLGESRRVFADQFILKADAYYHQGFYPSVFELAQPDGKTHMAKETEGHAHHDHTPSLRARSVFPDASGEPLSGSGSSNIEPGTPLEERWGGWYVTGTIVRPIRYAVRVARTVADGDLSSEIQIRTRDEIGQLSAALKDMNSSLISIVSEVRKGTDSIGTASKEIAAVVSALELAAEAGDTGAADELRAKLAQNPDDHQTRYELAVALYGANKSEEAVDELIAIIKAKRDWNEDAARKQLLKIFEALGFTNPIAVAGRRKLSSVLFS